MMKSQRRRVRQQRQKNNHDRRRMNSITTTSNNNRGIRLSRSCCHRGKLGLAMHLVAALTAAVRSTCSSIGVAKALSTTTTTTTTNKSTRTTYSNDLPLTVAVTNGRRQQQHSSRSRTTRLNLFFNQRDENGNIIKSSQKSRGRGKRGREDRQPFITSETLENCAVLQE